MQIMKQSLLRQLLNVWTILCKQRYLLCAYVANKVVNITPPLFASTGRSFTRFALLVVVLIGGVNVWGAETYTADFSSGNPTSKDAGTIDKENITWSYTKLAYSSTSNSAWHIGSNNNPQTTAWTISTPISHFGKVTQVSITAWTAGSATYSITIGSAPATTGNLTTSSSAIHQSAIVSQTAGNISVTLKASSKAIYLKSISVTYEELTGKSITFLINGDNGSSYIRSDYYNPGNITDGAIAPNPLTNISFGKSFQIEAVPGSGYEFVSWGTTVDGTLPEDKTANPITFTMGSEDATVTANFKEESATPTMHYVNWYVNGIGVELTEAADGTKPIVPEGMDKYTNIECNGKEFVGWSAKQTGITEADVFKTQALEAISSETNYYAVYATPSGGGESTKTLDLVTKMQATTYTAENLIYSNNPITLSVSQASNSTAANNSYGNGTETRFYKNNPVTISAGGAVISSIVLTITSKEYVDEIENATWMNKEELIVSNTTTVTITPTAGATSVSFTPNGQTRIKTVEVTYGGSSASYSDYTTSCEEQETTYKIEPVVNPTDAGKIEISKTTGLINKDKEVIQATAKPGYTFKNWTFTGTGASIDDVNSDLTEITVGTSDIILTANFEELPPLTITWNVNGITTTSTVTSGTKPVPPTDINTTGECDHVFIGWTANTISGSPTTAPTDLFTTEAKEAVTANTTYYAVFKDVIRESLLETWEPVTDVGTLAIGDQVIIVAADEDFAMSTEQKANNRGQTEYSKGTTPSSDVQIFTLEAGTKANTWAFNTGGGYIYAAGSKSGNNNNYYLRTEDAKSDNSSYQITIQAEGTSIIAQGSNTNKVLQYNTASDLFSCYASATQEAVMLYKKIVNYNETILGYMTSYSCISHNLTMAVDGQGTTTPAAGAVTPIYQNKNTTIKATPATGYTFGGWEVEKTDPDSEGTVATITDATALETTLIMGTTAVTVTAKFVEGEWEIVKNENFLQPGDKVVIADNAAAAVACAGAAGANNLGSQPARFSDDKLTITYLPEAAQIFTLATTEDKRWRFFNDNGTLGANSEKDSRLNFNVPNPMTQWAISVTSGSPYTAKILALEGSNSRTIFHHNAVNKYFTALESKGGDQNNNDPNLYYKKTNIPRIIVSTYSLDAFTYPDGRGPSTSKTFTVKGINIHNDASVTLTASADWQICETKDGTYSTSISLSYDEIENKEVTIFVRMGKGLDEGNVSGTLRAVSTDAQARTISLSGTVTPTHEVIWMSEGEQYGMEYVLDNEQAHIPSDPTPAGNCVGKVFVGWSATNIVDNEGKPISIDDRPSDLFTTAPTITADVTYYAVWADATGAGESNIYKPVTTAPEDWSGNYVIVHTDNAHAMSSDFYKNDPNEKEFNAKTITINNGVITTPSNDITWELTKREGSNSYYMRSLAADKYAKISANSTTGAALTDTKDDSFTIEANGETLWRVRSTNYSTRIFRYYNSDSPTFRTYSITNQDSYVTGYLYKQEVNYTYSSYSTSCPCDAPSTPLAIAGETFGTLPIDGSAFTKTFAIVEGSGNVNAVQWEVEPYTASLNRETGVFSTTTAGTYTITAMQSRNGDYCKQVASITFEVRIPDVDYTVTFVDGGKSLATKTVDWGSTVTPPTSPASCPDCMFVGWTTDESIPDENVAPSLFNFNETTIKGDITLRAVYDKGTCEDTYSRIESTPTEYDAEYVLASPNGQYGMIGVLANGQMTVVPIVNEDNPPTLSTITEPVEDLVWQITKHEGTDYYRVFNRNMHKYLSIAADGSISLGSTPADVYIEFSDEYKELTIYNVSRTYALTWGSSFSRPLSTQDTYDEDTKTYYIATWGFYLYERDCEDAQYTFTSTCCANNPTNVVATATATTITISWDCPVDNADLRIYTNDASEIVDKAVEGKTGFTHTFTGLTKNTDYFIRIWGNGDCAGELTHVTTTDATVDIVDWGTYEGADNGNGYKTGVTLNLSDPDVEATVSVGSETIITEDNERAAATELFFSKYYEAAGDLKMIAIYNGTNTAIDLTDYVIYITEEREFLNLAGQDHTLVLTDYAASIPAGAEYIFYRTGDEMDLTTNNGETLKDCIKFTIQDKLGNAKGLGQETWFETEECVWSGKQSLALFKGDKMIDIIGSHTGSADQEDWSGVDADNSKQLVLKDNWTTIKETYFPAYEGPDFHGDNNGFVALGKSYEDQKDIILSTNRCLLIRKNTVTSGTNAVQSNYSGQGFATLGTEWEGKNISVGGSNTDATTITNVCSSFSAICSFDYTQYYVTYTPLTLENPTLGGMLNTDGTFTIPLDVDNLACKRIKIETKKGDEVLLSTQVRVPIIVDENTTTDGAIFTTHINEIHKAGESSEDLSAEEIAAICKTCDVVVKGGEVTLTHAENTIPQINNLTVQNGAKLKVNDGKHFTVASVTLRSDKDVVPHLILPNNTSELASNQKIVRFTKRIPGDRYYFFSLPFDCNVEDIMLSNGQKAIFNRDIYILYYDGAKRAKEGSSIGGDNWVDIDPTQPLVAGQGYALAVENTLPTEVIFPMTITNTALHELDNASKTINITAHGFDEHGNNISGKKPNNIGWNFVGNPYFTHYGTLADVDLKHGKIEVVDGVVGETWSDVTSLYVNVPEENTDENYIQKKASDINLSPFFPFFVQVGKTGTLEYTPGTRVLPAAIASRYAQEMEDSENSTPIYVGVSLSNGQKSDETSLVINNRFTQEYEVGADLEKLLGFADKPQVYVKDDNYRYAFKALNETDAANTNTVGVYLPAKEATTYTFDIMRNYDLSRVQGVYLTDHVAGTVTNLLQEKYVFTSGYSYTNNRFALSVVLAPKDVTSLTDIEAAWSVWQDAPLHISLQGLCVGDAIRVIDATGKLVSRLTATETSAMFDLPTAGSYCVQTIGVNGMQMKKIVVR